MLLTQRILREAGFESEIFCLVFGSDIEGAVRHAREYVDDPRNVMLVHYSLGGPQDVWIDALQSRCVLVYHNITPAHFFPPGSELRRLSESGRRQLEQWAQIGRFVGAIADSDFNATELKSWGYENIASIPLLVDLERLRALSPAASLPVSMDGFRNILFVGRLCEHKGQRDLIRMLPPLMRRIDQPVRLLLAGATSSSDYDNLVRQDVRAYGLEDHVMLLGKLPDEEIKGLYGAVDAYVSLSKHEGFGMPLVEAMSMDLPVVALSAGSIAATLGDGGLIIESAESTESAAAVGLLLREPALRRSIIEAQRRSLDRYERHNLVAAFERHLRRLGVEATLQKDVAPAPPRSSRWLVEGPFDSSYSLALVNRELARALSNRAVTVGLLARDGPGPYKPSETFLADNPEFASMATTAPGKNSVVLRNQYPPHVDAMHGDMRVMCNYAWEESGFPAKHVRDFNATLDLVTVTSAYVAKVLRDSGVHTPIAVVGNGVDHITQGDRKVASPARTQPAPIFRFLHVSSAFPRKGIDALFAAWERAFGPGDPVELVIKTFANPHNVVDAELRALRDRGATTAPIRVNNDEFTTEQMLAAYRSADAIVCPSRGEGFGLPLAEALLLGRPVITTGYGGQTDFCSQQTAWLCDYQFAHAKSHLSQANSLWVDPDVASLAAAMRDCFLATPQERSRRGEEGRRLITQRYTWDQVAQRTIHAVDGVSRQVNEQFRLPKIGWVTTWNVKCGIAAYAKSLASHIEPERLVVFANRAADLTAPDDESVFRCWSQGWDDDLSGLLAAIRASAVDAVALQFNFGFFDLGAFGRLIERLVADNVSVFITLHATADLVRPERELSLQQIAPALRKATRLIVHSVHDLNRLKAFGLAANATLFPMGLPALPTVDRAAKRAELGLKGKKIVASFGYLLPHKGLRELISAFADVRARDRRAHLLMLNAIYPIAESHTERRACAALIEELGLQRSVTLCADYLSEDEAVARLSAADLIVYPYQHTQESASAAVKMGLGSLAPVAVTPLDIFSDVAGMSHALSGMSAPDIAAGVSALLASDGERNKFRAVQHNYAIENQWNFLSRRFADLIRGAVYDKKMFGQLTLNA